MNRATGVPVAHVESRLSGRPDLPSPDVGSLGFTFVVVTHELQSIFAIGDRAIMLDPVSRSIIATGKPTDLRDQSDDPRVRQFFNRQPDAAAQLAKG
jgi:ABC-type transporter Mla maintaining outer membrane lipid asymmetry ATPase subunit MlaF